MIKRLTMNTKHLLLLLLGFFYVGSQSAQDCLPSGIVFDTQEQIDSFPTNFPGCNKIMGNVIIRERFQQTISNLDSLYQLNTLGGFLEISHNLSLESLEGLEHVTSLEGSLVIEENHALDSLKGLENLRSIGGNLSVLSNLSLKNFQGIGNVESVGANVQIHDNDLIKNL